LVYSPNFEEHVQHLNWVFELLKKNQLYANKKKCEFAKAELVYLGHIISKEGVSVDPSKVAVMNAWPTPKNIKELRGFLGLTGYYRKFVKNYGKIATPLTSQLKKENFAWNEEAEESFQCLKKAMTQVPILAMPNFDKAFVIETDASGYGLGAVLSQEDRPIAFYSRTLGTRAQLKPIYEKELMAIVFAISKWRPYILGRHFIVRSDQQILKFLLEQRVIGEEYQKWVSKLMCYDFEIQYRTGSSNKVADALSRVTPECLELVVPQWYLWDELKQELENDSFLKKIREEMQSGVNNHVGFTVCNGVLYYKNRLVIPKGSRFIQVILKEFHNSPIGGHSGETKTYQRLCAELFWEGMRKDVVAFVRECEACQRSKNLTYSPAGLIQPLPCPSLVWDDITMDFNEGLPKSKGKDVILVVVDRLSKYAHFIALKHPFTAKNVAEIFIQEVVKLHGVPNSIVSDRDRIFLSHFWQELFKLQGSTLKKSTAYHPQTDGQSEVVNRCLEVYLRCFAYEKPKIWAEYLVWAEFWYNTTKHSTTQATPFKILYGRDPPPLIRYTRGLSTVSAVDQLLADRDDVLDNLKMQLIRAQQRMQITANKHRRDVEFQVGDQVLIKLRPYRQKSLVSRCNEKLAARYYGPYTVKQRVGKVAYRLELPHDVAIHSVFHVSQLRPAHGNFQPTTKIPSQLTAELELKVEPEKLLAVRQFTVSNNHQLEVLIKWQNLPEFEATWELFDLMCAQFPEFHLEDKVAVWKGSIDKAPVRLVYTRRKTISKKHTGGGNIVVALKDKIN
jgi:hypothetical protein